MDETAQMLAQLRELDHKVERLLRENEALRRLVLTVQQQVFAARST